MGSATAGRGAGQGHGMCGAFHCHRDPRDHRAFGFVGHRKEWGGGAARGQRAAETLLGLGACGGGGQEASNPVAERCRKTAGESQKTVENGGRLRKMRNCKKCEKLRTSTPRPPPHGTCGMRRTPFIVHPLVAQGVKINSALVFSRVSLPASVGFIVHISKMPFSTPPAALCKRLGHLSIDRRHFGGSLEAPKHVATGLHVPPPSVPRRRCDRGLHRGLHGGLHGGFRHWSAGEQHTRQRP